MALDRNQKSEQLTELKEKMSRASSVMFANYIGLSVSDVSNLRNQLRKEGAEMKVAKKTLMKLAAKENGLPEIPDSALPGPVSLIFSFEDPMTGAQVAFKFGKKNDKVKLVGGIFDGKLLTATQAMELAKMPGRPVLLATFMGMIQSPLRSFASICNSPLSGFARATQELAKKGGVPTQA